MAKKMTKSEMKMGTNSSATQRKFDIGVPTTGAALQGFIVEAPRVLSLMNRRLYRANRMYRMKLTLNSGTTDTVDIPVYALANNWYTRKAINLAKTMFDLAVEEERATVGSARWNDFRIKPDIAATQVPSSDALTALPFVYEYDGDKAVIQYGTTGEYNYSEVEVSGAPKSFSIGRASSADRYNIFEEFDNMGPNSQESPIGTVTGGYDLVDANFNEEEVQELLNKGNLPPYEGDLTGTTPQVWVEVGRLGQLSSGNAQLTTGYFDAPLGLLWVPSVVLGDETATPKLNVEFESGDYKGVMSLDI
jgi:hypothetical protein